MFRYIHGSKMCACFNFYYHIAGNLMGGNFDGFDAFQPDSQNLTRQILKAIECLVKDTDHPSKYFPSNI